MVDFYDDAISTNRRQQLLTYKNSIIDRVEDLTKQVEHASIDPECRADDMIMTCVKRTTLLVILFVMCLVFHIYLIVV